jgi:hypothetical protein
MADKLTSAQHHELQDAFNVFDSGMMDKSQSYKFIIF